jgi:NADH-quinone oxidoreductase subunit G
MFADKQAGYLLLGLEPELDCSAAATDALKQAQFVVSMSAFINDAAKEYADVLLPIAPFTETSGTFVNAEGTWQSFKGLVEPLAESRPAWKVLRVLGNLFDCAGFDYVTSQEVLDEVKALAANVSPTNEMSWHCPATLKIDTQGYESITDRAMYAGDCLQRRASSLQNVSQARQIAIRVNQAMASNAGLTDGEQAMAKTNNMELTLPVVIDERVPDDGVLVSSHLPQSSSMGEVTLSRV